jgi:hypothetical protein
LISDLAQLLDAVPLAIVPAVLIALFYIAAELGFQTHRRFGGAGSAQDESQVLSTALLVLALLLGFTFSMALGRYDERRQLVVQEANDIGTAWCRSATGAERLCTGAADEPAAIRDGKAGDGGTAA